MKSALVLVLIAGLALQTGCTTVTPEQQATLMGAGLGAGLGAVLGNNLGNSSSDQGLAIAAGTLLGGALGNQAAKQSAMQQQIQAVQQQQFVTTVWIENSNGSKTPVVLRQTEGGQYIGPRGEYYGTMPSMEQLKQIYGM
jgi:uncharacterized protein YcfJ